jgi:hypothetical protein
MTFIGLLNKSMVSSKISTNYLFEICEFSLRLLIAFDMIYVYMAYKLQYAIRRNREVIIYFLFLPQIWLSLWIWGFGGGDDSHCGLLRYGTVQSGSGYLSNETKFPFILYLGIYEKMLLKWILDK